MAKHEKEKMRQSHGTFQIDVGHFEPSVPWSGQSQRIQELFQRSLTSFPAEQEQMDLVGQREALDRTNAQAKEKGIIKEPIVYRSPDPTGKCVVVTSFIHPVGSKFRLEEQSPYVTECQRQLFQYHKLAHRSGIRLPLYHEGSGGVRPNFQIKFPDGKTLPCFAPEAQQHLFDHPDFFKDIIDRMRTMEDAKLSFLDILGDVELLSLQSSETAKLDAEFKTRYKDAHATLMYSSQTPLADLPRAVEAVEKFDELCAQMEKDFVESGSRSPPDTLHRMVIGHAHVHPVITELLRKGVEVIAIDLSANPYPSIVGRTAGVENERYRWAKKYLEQST